MTRQERKKQLSIALAKFYQNPVARVSLELALSIGLILFLALFAIKPTLTTMSDLTKEIEDKTTLDAALGKKLAALNSAQQQLTALSDQLALLDQALPSSPTVIYNMKLIEKLATDSTVLLMTAQATDIPERIATKNSPAVELKPSTAAQKDIPIVMTVRGEYQDIRGFVQNLQYTRRTVVIDTMTFSLDESRGTKTLTANITTTFPYITDEAVNAE